MEETTDDNTRFWSYLKCAAAVFFATPGDPSGQMAIAGACGPLFAPAD